jgi:cold shock CspA family protein
VGTVASFDHASGLGEVALDDGRSCPFHATELADGTRRVEVGARIACLVVAGRAGRWEAVGIVSTERAGAQRDA